MWGMKVSEEEERSAMEEDHLMMDGSIQVSFTFMFPCLSIGRRELLQPFC